MSEVTACLLASIAVLIFILLAIRAYYLGRIARPPKIEVFRELVQKYRDARNDKERRFICYLSFPMIFRGTLGVFLSFIVAVASTVIMGGACGRDTVLGKIIWDCWNCVLKPKFNGIYPSSCN